MNFLQTILRTIFFWLDAIIYPLIGKVYNLFTNIAETTIIDQDIIKAFGGRIYALLGIFMLFKVSFSILNYIVNPDDFTDKNKGVSKLVSNVLISLSLLVITPMIFTEAYKLQSLILRDNAISNLIFGTVGGVSSNGTTNNSTSALDPGREMGFQTFKAFYYLDEENYTECAGIYSGTTKGNCANVFSENGTELVQIIENSVRSKSVPLYLSWDLLHAKDSNDNFVMTYTPIISTVCGVFIVLIFVTFCFDIAIRSVKLGFLQILAPIPIISRIDPKSSKDGMFDKWLKTCTTTYLDLFIRLISIYFAMFIISNVNLTAKSNVTGEVIQSNALVNVFIILGTLLFAKSLPQLIQDLLGIKLEGKFTINPMNKLRQTPLVGAAVTGTAALVGGAITGGIAGAQANHIGRGIFQGMMGAGRDIRGKISIMGDDKGKSPRAFSAGMQSGYKTITGKDFNVWSPWKQVGSSKGEGEIDQIKKSKYALQGQQAALDAQLQSLYDDYKTAPNENKREQIRKSIESNRSQYGKLSKYISVIDDQIKDVKRLYNVDDSPKADFEEAMAEASKYINRTQPVQPNIPTAGKPNVSNTNQPNVSQQNNSRTNKTNNVHKATRVDSKKVQ